MMTLKQLRVRPINIKENPQNEVTSHKIFPPRKMTGPDGSPIFSENSIFSEKIFGRFNKCKCGSLTRPGYCKKCKTRVISKKHMPDFYIKFDFDLPNKIINYGNYSHMSKTLESLLYYKGFIYHNEFYEFDLAKKSLLDFDETDVLIGKDAVKALGVSEDWYNTNVHRLISIPHTSYRPITIQGNSYVIGELNKIYAEMIKQNTKYKDSTKYGLFSIFAELNIKFIVCDCLSKLYDELFNIIAVHHNNVVDRELKGQPETGMIRAVLTNNFGLDEDTLLIGHHFISTLYPAFYKKYSTTDSQTGEVTVDIESINRELSTNNYYVLFNRQPTIGAKSIIAMKPKFSLKDEEMFVIQANPIVYDGLAADVDGDALNVIALYTEAANKEAERLLASRNYIEGSNYSVRNKIMKDLAFVDDNPIKLL